MMKLREASQWNRSSKSFRTLAPSEAKEKTRKTTMMKMRRRKKTPRRNQRKIIMKTLSSS
jgi:hypothetical protein